MEMKSEQAVSVVTNQPNPRIEDLIEVAFSQIKPLGAVEESSRLFPNGMGSLDLEICLRAEAKPDIRNTVGAASDETAAVDLRMEGDAEATFNAEGHQIIALIAEQDLCQLSPQTMRTVQKILDDPKPKK
jgi:hypothetical protein